MERIVLLLPQKHVLRTVTFICLPFSFSSDKMLFSHDGETVPGFLLQAGNLKHEFILILRESIQKEVKIHVARTVSCVLLFLRCILEEVVFFFACDVPKDSKSNDNNIFCIALSSLCTLAEYFSQSADPGPWRVLIHLCGNKAESACPIRDSASCWNELV